LKSRPVSIGGGEFTLEGVLHSPEADAPGPAVTVCHPHPLYGGNMHNNLVVAVCEALAEAGITALRFNFRGVGGSAGSHGDGVGERDDVKAALGFLAGGERIDPERIGLGGYSFGGGVAMAAADRRTKALALISPAADEADWAKLREFGGPKMIIGGGRDDIVTADGLRRNAGKTELKVVDGADHFWFGHEETAAAAVTGFFQANL